MNNSMIEKAARAMSTCRTEARNRNDAMLAERGLWPDRSFHPTDQEYVRAVLTAIRSPDEAMMKAMYEDADAPIGRSYIAAAWQAAIDAILKETP